MTRQLSLPSAGARRSLLRRRHDQRGAALVEFSLVIGIFVMVLYGLIYFGMALATKQRVTNAAAEGARAAVGAATDGEAQTIAQARVDGLLDDLAGRYVVVPVAAPCVVGDIGGPKCITVTVTYDWAAHPVVPAAPGLGVFPINNLGSKATVQYSG